MLKSLERATKENFDSRAYLLANPDLEKSGLTSPDDLARHFYQFGIQEDRSQISRELITDSEYRKRKFELFKETLTAIPPSVHSFPISYGDVHYSQEDYQAESANADCGDFIAVATNNPTKKYLDLGCGFRDTVLSNVLYVEVYPSIAADIIVAPNELYPLKSNSFDGIVCADVLEHVRRPWETVKEIHRMLKPGGAVFISWPFLQPTHGFPSHYFNATREGLTTLFADSGFTIATVDTRDHQAPDYTVKWIMNSLISALPVELKKKLLNSTIAEIMAVEEGTGIWREVLDHLPRRTRSELACGNFLVGTKRQ